MKSENGKYKACTRDMETECHVPSEDVDNACEAGAEGDAAEKTAPGSTVAEGTAAQEDLERKLAEAEAKAQENWNMYLRALADLENYRRRTARDLAFHIRSGKKDLILKLLTVVDDMERALAAEADYEALHPFDPRFHEAVAACDDPEVDTDTLVEEFRRGYTYEDEVIRATMARVARPSRS